MKVWDIQQQRECFNIADHTDVIHSFEWNENGSLVASTSKDKYAALCSFVL